MRLAFGSVINAELASFVGLPAAGPGGYPWQYCRAGLEYSLSSELKLNAERVSGYQYTANLISVLDPRKKHGAERQPIPPLAYFERNLNGSERNPADRIALTHVASLIHGADGPVQLPDAIALYMEKRHAFLTMVKEHHYILMKVPSYVSELEAVEVASEGSEDEDEGDAADESESEVASAAVLAALQQLVADAESDPDAAADAILATTSIWRCCDSGARSPAWKCGGCNLWTHRTCQRRACGADRANPLCKACFVEAVAAASKEGPRESRHGL